MADDLRPKERGVLLALVLSGLTQLTSKELGIDVDKQTREALESRGLVTYGKRKQPGNPLEYALTSAGRKWCLDDVTAGASRPGDSALERSFYALLAAVRTGVDVRALVDTPSAESVKSQTMTAADDVETEVRAAYRKLRKKPGAWVSLADIRDELDGLSRPAVDEALKGLVGQSGVFLEPEMNQSSLTRRDRDAAVRVGGEFNHYIKIERV